MRRGLSNAVALLAGIQLLAPAVRAQEVELPEAQITVGALLQYTTSTICSAESDTVDCGGVAAFFGGHLNPRWRISPAASLGLISSLGWDLSGTGTESSNGESTTQTHLFWRLTAEGRLHLDRDQPFGFWVGLEAGLAGMTQRDTAYSASGDEIESQAATQLAPILGPGLGADWALGRVVGLGFGLRGLVALFPEDPDFNAGRRLTVGDSFWIALTLDVTFNVWLSRP